MLITAKLVRVSFHHRRVPQQDKLNPKRELNSCIITLPSVSTNAVPPFAEATQNQKVNAVQIRQKVYMSTAQIAQPVMTRIPKARQTSVTTTAQSTQKSHDHQLQLLVVSHTDLMQATTVVVIH